MSGGEISGNKAKRGGSAYDDGKGGGVYSQGSFTMSGGTITKNKANTDGKAVMLNHYFYWQGGEIKDNQGNGSVVGGSGYYFQNNTSPRKEPS